jgi:hypothetical protein
VARKQHLGVIPMGIAHRVQPLAMLSIRGSDRRHARVHQPCAAESFGFGAQSMRCPRGSSAISQHAWSIAPLPFAPASLPGLSERTLVSHHHNNYGGAVRRSWVPTRRSPART